jgi:hypothetical protein
MWSYGHSECRPDSGHSPCLSFRSTIPERLAASTAVDKADPIWTPWERCREAVRDRAPSHAASIYSRFR